MIHLTMDQPLLMLFVLIDTLFPVIILFILMTWLEIPSMAIMIPRIGDAIYN